MYATRLKAVLAVLAGLVLFLLVGLFRLQVLRGKEYRNEAVEHLKRPPGFHPTIRGTIYDRNGIALAQDAGAFDVAIYFPFIEMDDEFVAQTAASWKISPDELRLRVHKMWPELAHLTNMPLAELERRAETIRQRVDVIRRTVAERHGRRITVREETYDLQTGMPHPLVQDIDPEAYQKISSRPGDFPGLVLLESRRREYLYGGVAPHVVGRLGEVSSDELNSDDSERNINAPYGPGHLKRYWPGDLVGRSGVEACSEDLLRGERGVCQTGLDGSSLEDIAPVPGRDIHLTLDIALQADVERLLDAPPALPAGTRISGAAVVLDCTTGEVLVLASAPRLNVNYYAADFPDLLRDPAGPLVHRAVAGRYPLGSIFKAVTATTALHEGAITPDTSLTCDGMLDPERPDRFRCHVYLSQGRGHGPIELHEAIKRSCNVFFYKVAELLSLDPVTHRRDLRRGRDVLTAWARRLGLGRATGIGLAGEADGSVKVDDPRNLAVGQGELLVTPLQAAQVYGLVATDGRMPPLTLIRERPGNPSVRDDLRQRPLNPVYMQAIRDGFDAVVNEPGGTGYSTVRLEEVRIAGKTGTAQVGEGKDDHAWFVGYAPADHPRLAFSVIVEHGGHGGETAGPIAREIVKACLAHGYFGDRPATVITQPPPESLPAPADGSRPHREPLG